MEKHVEAVWVSLERLNFLTIVNLELLKTRLERNRAPGRTTTGTNFTQKVPIRFEPIMLTTQLHGTPIDPPIF